ncbi:putative ABC transport system ATP-binding protein [Chitinivorax tropicus]|uniref:Putative ABC transport system ATP-binding protein n=1 Tax=Chitinivorax tropicus TaxID=714531 RepID=A0A840ML73_9PROT|nr:ATP-binding cassette domain-containing protein [Chitinivorax tropicus]MBB5019398.1 putative ABC transport system ATP-binding protein [Chitinivorax tropicus]
MLSIQQLEFTYPGGRPIRFPDWQLSQGDIALLLGPSGSGKSTLVAMLAGLLTPRAGTIGIAGQVLQQLSGHALDHFRGRHIGFVPQQLHLLPLLSVRENLRLAQTLAGQKRDDVRIDHVLKSLGIEALANRRPGALSQGQKQRAAIARATVNTPKLLLADEPTANLDDQAAEAALDVLLDAARACAATLVIATHDSRVKHRIANQLTLGVQS